MKTMDPTGLDAPRPDAAPGLPPGPGLGSGSDARGWSAVRAALVLVPFTVAIHLNSLSAFFVGDDFDFLVRFSRMESVVESVAFEYWGEWEPLWWLTWYLDVKAWGPSPLGYHLGSLAWLVLAVVAIYGLLRSCWPEAPLAAWGAALLFAAHPLHDEAVTYLAARGHVMTVACSFVALWLYVAYRKHADTNVGRLALAAALVSALLAALAKEIALTLPACVGVLEWLVLSRTAPRLRAFGRGVVAGSWFLLSGVAYFALRYATVGLSSGKLSHGLHDPAAVLARVLDSLPSYALSGLLPIPFAFTDYPVLDSAAPLGWVLVALVVASAAWAYAIGATRPRKLPDAGLVAFGFVLVAATLAPVFWADLPLRRRYFFFPSAGILIMASVVLHWIWLRRPRLATGLLVLAVAGFAVGTYERNAIYTRAGAVTRNLVETIREAPIGQPPPWPRDRAPRVVFFSLPRTYDGDFYSGAYLMHRTDLHSALTLFGFDRSGVHHGLEVYHAEDHSTRAGFGDDGQLRVEVSFRTQRAFEAVRRRDPQADRVGRFVEARLESESPDELKLVYVVEVPRAFWSSGSNRFYLYGDGVFTRVVRSD